MELTTMNKASLILCALIVSGCSSKPREVSASLPLVSISQEKPDKQQVPAQYWPSLSDANQTALEHQKYQIQLEELYTSALGNRCRELKIFDKQQTMQKRVACEISFINANNQKETAWFLEKEIIESSAYIEL